jgi:hypothetical protein
VGFIATTDAGDSNRSGDGGRSVGILDAGGGGRGGISWPVVAAGSGSDGKVVLVY